MRNRDEPKALFENLAARGNIIVHASTDEACAAITKSWFH
jgi:hypothetical protein